MPAMNPPSPSGRSHGHPPSVYDERSMTTDAQAVEERLATLERQTQWLSIELDRVKTVLLSMAAATNEALLLEQ